MDAACMYMRSEFASFYVSGILEEKCDGIKPSGACLFTKAEKEVKHLGQS